MYDLRFVRFNPKKKYCEEWQIHPNTLLLSLSDLYLRDFLLIFYKIFYNFQAIFITIPVDDRDHRMCLHSTQSLILITFSGSDWILLISLLFIIKVTFCDAVFLCKTVARHSLFTPVTFYLHTVSQT